MLNLVVVLIFVSLLLLKNHWNGRAVNPPFSACGNGALCLLPACFLQHNCTFQVLWEGTT